MPVGTVKWFNNAKGFGFILPEGGGEDLFAHYSAIEMDGYRTLRAGQTVDFEVSRGAKGLHAINIRASESNQKTNASEPTEESTRESSKTTNALEAEDC